MAKPNLTTRITQATVQLELYGTEMDMTTDRVYREALRAHLYVPLYEEIERMEKRRDRIEYLKDMKAKGRNPVAEEFQAAYMAYYKRDGRRRNPQLRG